MNDWVVVGFVVLSMVFGVSLLLMASGKPKYPGPTIDEVRSRLSTTKQSLKGTDALKAGVSVHVIADQTTGNVRVSDRGPIERQSSEETVEVRLNSRSNCLDLARGAVHQFRTRHTERVRGRR